ncbi:hypothetical protein NBRC111894_4615 [Sporolactobacillus inulinus]|uniref:Uncharacterized protein n=1 Tax=Sporolactobacillus inulinus TaxID=2078 RepID=A0A4Y1ZJA8_9BACL|nr:hypothetical protein NBRC111894_4615 [Sporolactobacillus inulinus]
MPGITYDEFFREFFRECILLFLALFSCCPCTFTECFAIQAAPFAVPVNDGIRF